MSPSSSTEAEERCRRFLERVEECVKSKADNIKSLTVERYAEITARLEELSTRPELRRTVADRQLLKRFQLLQVQQVKVLVKRDTRLRVVTLDRLYDTIQEAHLACGHGGRDNTYAEIQHRFANVTKEQISAFVELCDECTAKKRVKGGAKKQTEGSVNVKPPASNEANRGRCQVDFVDMQAKPDGEFRFILVYRDQLNKMIFLRAIRDKVAEEAAPYLVDIFAEFGAPHLLHSTLGDEFVDQMAKEVRKLWPECRLVRGRATMCQSDGHFKRENREIRGRVLCWMRDTRSSRWTRALRLVQFARNAATHRRIGRPPFHAVFGATPKLGLAGVAAGLSQEVIGTLITEEQLTDALPSVVASGATVPAERSITDEREPDGAASERPRGRAATRPSCTACQGAIGGSAAKCHSCQLPCHPTGPCATPTGADCEPDSVTCALCHLRRQIQVARSAHGQQPTASTPTSKRRASERPPPWERGGGQEAEVGVVAKQARGSRVPLPLAPTPPDSFHHHNHHHHHAHQPQQQHLPHQQQQSRQPLLNQPTYGRGHQFAPCGGERFLLDPREVNGNFQLGAYGNNPGPGHGGPPYADGISYINNRA